MGFLIYRVVEQLSPSTLAVATPDSITQPSQTAPVAVTQDAEISIGIRIGQRAPDFRLASLDHEDVSLSDFRGKIVILDFWASWCGPCKSTMPGLEDLARTLASDVVLLGVSLDRSEANAADYLDANNFHAMIGLYGSYADAYRVSGTYGVTGIPKTFIIDRDGIIRYVGHPASLSRQTLERLL
ncbi:TlpA family protein disulfide reductase [Candidatus Bipolaricaulota bacterium]|nr:TlpA family protein disulfide reductase [Candidatus Bipolaricaulota bacterium]